MAHTFGGLWTRKKLQVLAEYLKFYTTALKQQPFRLHYADAFAGSGFFRPPSPEEQHLLIPLEDFKGSVLTALEVEPPFHHYHFNDLSPEHVSALEEIQRQHPTRKVEVTKLDANEFVARFCAELGTKDRGVLFLDPYSTQLRWQTLAHVSQCQKVDLWLLFPLFAVLRMTPTAGVMPEWRTKLNLLLGTNEWEQALYQPMPEPMMQDLFDNPSTAQPERMNHIALRDWVTSRLRSVFPYVEEPYLLTNNNRPLFLFYFAVSNTNQKAQALAQRAAAHIIKANIGSS